MNIYTPVYTTYSVLNVPQIIIKVKNIQSKDQHLISTETANNCMSSRKHAIYVRKTVPIHVLHLGIVHKLKGKIKMDRYLFLMKNLS